MKKFLLIISLAAVAHAQTVDELMQKNFAARGGAKLKALKAVALTGVMSMGPMQAKLKIEKSRPDRFRMDVALDGGVSLTQAYDGTTGWSIQPGQHDAAKMSDEDLAAIREQVDFDGPLIDYKKKGNKLELLGRADVDGKPAWKLKLTTKDGQDTIVYLDAASFLEVRDEQTVKIEGQDVPTQTSISGYREVEGVRFATRVEARPIAATPDPAASQVFTIDKIEVNPQLPADTFSMPK